MSRATVSIADGYGNSCTRDITDEGVGDVGEMFVYMDACVDCLQGMGFQDCSIIRALTAAAEGLVKEDVV